MLLFMYIIAPAWICMCIVKLNLGFLGFKTSPQQPCHLKGNTLLQSPRSRHGLSAMPSRDQPACNAREQQQRKFHARCGPFSKFNLLSQSGGLLVVWGLEMGCRKKNLRKTFPRPTKRNDWLYGHGKVGSWRFVDNQRCLQLVCSS